MSMHESKSSELLSHMANDKLIILFKDMFKYGFVSVFALAVDAGLLYLLVEHFQVHYMYAATIAFGSGLAINYILAKKFVFKKSKLSPAQEFIYYASIGIIGLALNDLIIYLLVSLNLWYMYAKVVSVAVVFFFNFFGRRRLFTHQ